MSGGNEIAVTTLFKILAGEMEADSGEFKWGITITNAYFPKDNSQYFNDCHLSLVDWLRQYSDEKGRKLYKRILRKNVILW